MKHLGTSSSRAEASRGGTCSRRPGTYPHRAGVTARADPSSCLELPRPSGRGLFPQPLSGGVSSAHGRVSLRMKPWAACPPRTRPPSAAGVALPVKQNRQDHEVPVQTARRMRGAGRLRHAHAAPLTYSALDPLQGTAYECFRRAMRHSGGRNAAAPLPLSGGVISMDTPIPCGWRLLPGRAQGESHHPSAECSKARVCHLEGDDRSQRVRPALDLNERLS